MESQKIEFMVPTSNAFNRMKQILFKPFDMGKWFILGFSAWLAQLLEGGGGVNFPSNSGNLGPQSAQWAKQNIELVIAIIVVAVTIFFIIGLVLLWVRSRGKFMLLDNVVHNRALVKAPWAEYRMQGNSLFIWELVLSALTFIVVLVFGGVIGWLVYIQFRAKEFNVVFTVIAALLGLTLLFLIIVMGYIRRMLQEFVVAIMYHEHLTATDAWSRFMDLHRVAMGKFILYYLWRGLLNIGAASMLSMLGLLTCCIGYILLAIPYLGVVIILPVAVFFRCLGPEFLKQFGDDFDLFHNPEDLSLCPICRKEAPEDAIEFGDKKVCPGCKPLYDQRLREGLSE